MLIKKMIVFYVFLLIAIGCTKQKRDLELIQYCREGKWGFSDINKNIIIEPEYDRVTSFINGISFVNDGQYWGVINKEGEKIIDLDYTYIGLNEEGFIEAWMKPPIVPSVTEVLFNLSGKELIRTNADIDNFGEGLASFYEMTKGNNFIDTNGKIVIHLGYNYIPLTPFMNGSAIIEDRENEQYIRINKEREGLNYIDLKYQSWLDLKFKALNKNFIKVTQNHDEEGVLNTYGNFIIPVKKWVIQFLENKNLFIISQNKKYGIFNEDGNQIIPFVYDSIDDLGKNLFVVRKNNRYYLMSTLGTIQTEQGYRFIFGDAEENELISVSNDEKKYGIIDGRGKLMIPIKYNRVGSFGEGKVGVELNGKWGFINTLDSLVIKCQYDWVGKFENGIAIVGLKSKYSLIDTLGNPITNKLYDNIYRVDNKPFENPDWSDKYGFQPKNDDDKFNRSQNFYYVVSSGRKGMIDFKGNEY